MEILLYIIDVFLHLNKYIVLWADALGLWFYAVVFVVVFIETGLVIMPFLPGDSLLFACGAIAALDGSPVNIYAVCAVLIAAAILGDSCNYLIGKEIGPKIFSSKKSRWLNRKHLQKTHDFYEKHGGKTIILARFIPILRTFAPFVAGIGKMHYTRFLIFNVVGAFLWVLLFTIAGYLFADIPFVQNQFHYVVIAIIGISCLPIVYEFVMEKYVRKS